MPPAAYPNSLESNNIITLPLVQKNVQSQYALPEAVPRISDYTGNAGALFVANREGNGIVSVRRLDKVKIEDTAYLTGLHLNFVGLTVGGIREVSQTCGVNVAGSGTVLHCQPYQYNGESAQPMFLQIGARVAFELPPFSNDYDIGQKRFYQNQESENFVNDGIRVRRSRITDSPNTLREWVETQVGGDDGMETARKILELPRDTDPEVIAYACEQHYTFGISLTNLKKARDSTSVRVLVSPV